MTIVLEMGLCNPLLYNARIGYANTHDMRAKFTNIHLHVYCM